MTACVGLTPSTVCIFSLLTLSCRSGQILAFYSWTGVSRVPGMSHCGNERPTVPGSPVTACNEKSLISFSKMAFVILQNILRWHSSKIPAGGANLWVGLGVLNVRCEDGGGSHQFQ